MSFLLVVATVAVYQRVKRQVECAQLSRRSCCYSKTTGMLRFSYCEQRLWRSDPWGNRRTSSFLVGPLQSHYRRCFMGPITVAGSLCSIEPSMTRPLDAGKNEAGQLAVGTLPTMSGGTAHCPQRFQPKQTKLLSAVSAQVCSVPAATDTTFSRPPGTAHCPLLLEPM